MDDFLDLLNTKYVKNGQENISRCEKYQVWKGQNNFPTQSPTRGERGNPQSGMEGGFCKIFGYNTRNWGKRKKADSQKYFCRQTIQ